MLRKKVLVTGGAGYIGAHVVRQLIKNDYDVVIIDNLSTGMPGNVAAGAQLITGDYRDAELLKNVFTDHAVDAVIHMAASIEVGESVVMPIPYLENNATGTHTLLKAMTEAGVKNIIFSSTAAVYGMQKQMPIAEDAPTGPLDPYGYSKLIAEELIRFYAQSTGLRAIIFRYFNACGSDFDKTITDSHSSHLITFMGEVARGQHPHLSIFGDDYDTIDGTGVRDYVHVIDIARAHVAALSHISTVRGHTLFNIGTSSGLSVKQVVAAFERGTGKSMPVVIAARRPGDAPITVADNTKIRRELNFELQHSDIDTIIETSIR